MGRRKIGVIILLILALILSYRFYKAGDKIGQEDEGLLENGDLLEEEEEEIGPVYKWTTSSLRLRKGPSTDDEIILTMPRAAKVQVLESLAGWDKIDYNGQVGYASGEFLSLEEVIDEGRQEPDPNPQPVIGPKIIKGIILVNKKYGMPANLYKGIDPEAKEELDKMMEDIKKETGLALSLRSGHRTYELQEKFFDNNSRVNGLEHALKYSAKPGHSEHETGLAFDLCDIEQKYCLVESFENTVEGIWLRDNAHKYGFILRYPKGREKITGYAYEPWHFRYVGLEHAENIYERDITLEEYLLPDEY